MMIGNVWRWNGRGLRQLVKYHKIAVVFLDFCFLSLWRPKVRGAPADLRLSALGKQVSPVRADFNIENYI